MFALVEDGSITKYFSGNQGFTLGSNQYSKQVFTLWSEAERNAIGIYTVEMDTSKRKDEQWYTNTNVSYAFAGGKVTGSYGDATVKPHADTLFTAQDEEDGLGTEGEVKAEGLKTQLIRKIKQSKEYSKFDIEIKLPGKTETAIRNIKIPLLGLHKPLL